MSAWSGFILDELAQDLRKAGWNEDAVLQITDTMSRATPAREDHGKPTATGEVCAVCGFPKGFYAHQDFSLAYHPFEPTPSGLEEAARAIAEGHYYCAQCGHHLPEDGPWKAFQSHSGEWDLACPKCGCKTLLDDPREIADAALSTPTPADKEKP